MLGLILVVVVVANVILWSYQMNHFDWERNREKIMIYDVVPDSPWFVATNEFVVYGGIHVAGSYQDTQILDNKFVTYEKVPGNEPLEVIGNFSIDLSTYLLTHIDTISIQTFFRVNKPGITFNLQTYNWTGNAYSTEGFNSTVGCSTTGNWDLFSINIDEWTSYISNNGTVKVKFYSDQNKVKTAVVQIDFFAIKVNITGTNFVLQNNGPFTCHIVSLWINNSTDHQKFDVDFYINSGNTVHYIRGDISLPEEMCTVKIVTERGNVDVFSKK
jgi:hypothetical protein